MAVKSRPRVPWGGPPGVQRMRTPMEQLRRGGRGLVFLLNPLVAIGYLVLTVVFTRKVIIRRWRGKWIGLGGIAAALLVCLLGGLGTYALPYRELLEAVARAAGAGTFAWSGVWATVSERWPLWVAAQVPLATTVAVAAAGLWLWRRQWYMPTWRHTEKRDALAEVVAGKKAMERAHRQVRSAEAIQTAEQWSSSSLPLGATSEGKPYGLAAALMGGHGVVLGPTGFGKTTTLLRLIEGILVHWQAARHALVMFDFKGDVGLREEVKARAVMTGRRFWCVSVTEPGDGYNTIRHGTPEQVASRLVAAFNESETRAFESAYYMTSGQRWLTAGLYVLDDLIAREVKRGDGKPWTRTLVNLSMVLAPEFVKSAAPGLEGDLFQRVARLVKDYEAKDSGLRDGANGMCERIAWLAETSAGRVMDTAAGVDLLEAIQRGDVVLFSLAAGIDRDAAQMLGGLAVMDLTATFGVLEAQRWAKRTGRRAFVVLDEFGGLRGTTLTDLIERSRSAGGVLVLSAQLLANFREVSEEFASKVLLNARWWLMHRQPGKDGGDVAESLGTRTTWKETLQITEDADPLGTTTGGSGVGSLRETDEFAVHPNVLRELGPGEVIAATFSPNALTRVQVTETLPWAGAAVEAEERPAAGQDGPQDAPEGPGPAQEPQKPQGPARTPAQAAPIVEPAATSTEPVERHVQAAAAPVEDDEPDDEDAAALAGAADEWDRVPEGY